MIKWSKLLTLALPWLSLVLTEVCYHALYQEVHFGTLGYLLRSSQVEGALVLCSHLLLPTPHSHQACRVCP